MTSASFFQETNAKAPNIRNAIENLPIICAKPLNCERKKQGDDFSSG